MVGATGFEPATPCAQGSEQKYILLVRIAFLCVTEHGFIRYSAAFGPKLDPSFRLPPPQPVQVNASADGKLLSRPPLRVKHDLSGDFQVSCPRDYGRLAVQLHCIPYAIFVV